MRLKVRRCAERGNQAMIFRLGCAGLAGAPSAGCHHQRSLTCLDQTLPSRPGARYRRAEDPMTEFLSNDEVTPLLRGAEEEVARRLRGGPDEEQASGPSPGRSGIGWDEGAQGAGHLP